MGFGSEEGRKKLVCSNCGLRWVPVQRQQCINCGSDAGPMDEEEWNLTKKDSDAWDIPIKEMTPVEKATRIVYEYAKKHMGKSDRGSYPDFAIDHVKLVWFNYTLGGWKAMLITTLPDDHYYEVTYDKEMNLTYLDAYVKFENVVIHN